MEIIEWFESVATSLGNAGFFLLLAVFCGIGIWSFGEKFIAANNEYLDCSESEAPANPQPDKE